MIYSTVVGVFNCAKLKISLGAMLLVVLILMPVTGLFAQHATAPTDLIASNIGTTTATLNWTAPTTTPEEYQLHDGTATTTIDATLTNFVLSGLTPATQYTYTLYAVHTGSVLSDPAEVTFTTEDTVSTGSVTGLVWYNADGDQLFDDDEVAATGLTVVASSTSNSAVAFTTITDSNGQYDFPDMPIDTYTMTVLLSNGNKAVITNSYNDQTKTSITVTTTSGGTEQADLPIRQNDTIWPRGSGGDAFVNATIVNNNTGTLTVDDLDFLIVARSNANTSVSWNVSTTTIGGHGYQDGIRFPESLDVTFIAPLVRGYERSQWSGAGDLPCTDNGDGTASGVITDQGDPSTGCTITYTELTNGDVKIAAWDDTNSDGVYGTSTESLLTDQEFRAYDNSWNFIETISLNDPDTEASATLYEGDHVCQVIPSSRSYTGLDGNSTTTANGSGAADESISCHTADFSGGTPEMFYFGTEAATTGGGTASTNTVPVITLIGNVAVTLTVGDTYADAGATASDTEDGDITGDIVTVDPVDTSVADTYTVTYNVTDSDGAAADEVTRTVVVENTTSGSGGGGWIPTNTTTTPIPQVLGATIAKCAAETPLLTDYMRRGSDNDPFQVLFLQLFLWSEGAGNIALTGAYDAVTEAAVRAYQEEHRQAILTPWETAGYGPLTAGTGIVYQTTRAFINNQFCAGILETPGTLVPWSEAIS